MRSGPAQLALLQAKVERLQRAKAKVLEKALADAAEREAWARSIRCRQGKVLRSRPQAIRGQRP